MRNQVELAHNGLNVCNENSVAILEFFEVALCCVVLIQDFLCSYKMAYLLKKSCIARGCSSKGNDGKTKLISFPRGSSEKQKERYALWAELSGNPDLVRSRKMVYLCYKHFERRCFIDDLHSRLLQGSDPSIFAWCSSSDTTDTSLVTTTTTDTQRPNNVLSALPDTPSTSITKSFRPLQLFPPALDASNSSISNSDTLATPLDSSVSFEENVLANVVVDTTPASTSELKRKPRSLVLSKINVTRTRELTPRKKFLFDCLKTQRAALRRLQKEFKKKTMTLKDIMSLNGKSSLIVKQLSKSMSWEAAELLCSQLGRSQQAPKGHRWSTSEKLLALSLYKRSPKCYTLLRSIFTLPCKSTLINLLNRVPFCAGVNSQIYEALAKSVSKLEVENRICSLMFDEMSIREHLQYDPRSDRILGYEDLGGCRQPSNKVANHALVFMAKGLRSKWKQPVGFYFSHNGVSGRILADILKEVLEACRKAGLVVVTTVCDMGANNVTALKALGASFEKPFFMFNDQEIVTIFDPPHLLKCARNMLYKHDVRLNVKIGTEDPRVMIASWSHIRDAVMVDRQEPYHALHKISNTHLDPDAFKKMKVSYAAHVLSNTVAVNLNRMAREGKIPEDGQATAFYAATVNNLFDSINSSGKVPKGPGGLQCRLSRKNEAQLFQFWTTSIENIGCWQFLKKSPALGPNLQHIPQVLRPPSQDGWLATMRGVMHLWNSLKERDLEYLQTRALNQDPLEHLFGCIRANCGSNNNPTVNQFQAALKTAIVNGLAFKDLKGANCELKGDSGEVLNNLHDFLSSKPDTPCGQEPSPILKENTAIHNLVVEEMSISYSVAYVSGYIARRLLEGNTCNKCRSCLTSSEVEYFHTGISAKEYRADNRLIYPSEELCKAVGAGATLLENIMPDVAYLPGVWKRIADNIKETAHFAWIGESCVDHKVPMIDDIVRGICAISIPWWCKRANRANREKRSARKLKILNHM